MVVQELSELSNLTHIPMKLIVGLLRRVWQRSRPDPDAYAERATEGGDRSSMADFVRILRMLDQEHGSSNYHG